MRLFFARTPTKYNRYFMRVIITSLLVCLVAWVDLKPRPEPYQFQPLPEHIQYIQDSIQPPLPFNQIEIKIINRSLEPWIAGQTIQTNQTQFLILLNPAYHYRHHLTFYHELVHVKQMVRGHLKQIDTIWYWHNQPIDWQLPYHQRPWELEAIKEAAKCTQPNQSIQ